MQSKFSWQHLLSSRAIFIGAPCLIGLTAIAAVLTSMSMERSRISVGSPNALPTSPPPLTNIPAQSVTGQKATQSPIAASPLKNQGSSPQKKPAIAPSPSSPSSNPSKIRPTAKPASPASQAKAAKSTPQAKSKKTAPSKPAKKTAAQPTQTALSMQAFSPEAANDIPQVPIRVAIVRDASSFTVATSEAGLITDAQGQILKQIPAQNSVGVSTSSGGIQVGGLQSSSSVWIRTKSKNGLVFVNGQWYRGFVQLIPDQGKLLAVNHVEMQPYLYSVVGAEMFHDWPLEAHKAQAIAARSYALVHIVRPASPHFDLGSTQRWQAYKGVKSEASPVLKAVDATKGIVISHNGGVVESLYASSAELVRDAHKGFGMSQYGARDLARQNLNYRQILSRFYPGTELSLLQNQ